MMLIPLAARLRQLAPLTLVLISVAVAMGAYLQALNYPFSYDDDTYLAENTKLAGLHLADLWRLLVEPYNPYEFLPVRDFTYWLDMTLFGLEPAAFRIHNMILYLLCLPLVYGTTLGIWRLFRPADAAGAPWGAAIVTALFAIHPAHVEAVIWASARKDVLATLFSLLALWLAVNARRENGLSFRYALATLIALLAAMLSKATAVVVAPVIVMLWVIFWRDMPAANRSRSPLLWSLACLLSGACVVLTFTTNSTIRETVYFGVETLTRALAVLGWLARLAVSPESRHFCYPVLDDPSLAVMVVLGMAVLAGWLVSVAVILRRRLLECFALVVFGLLCIPYIQLIPYQTISLVSDRFLALAVWPVALLLVALAWRLNPVPRAVVLLAIALPWAFQTVERPRDWRNFATMADSDLRAYPGYYVPAVEKIVNVQFRPELMHEAMETARGITVPEIRDLLIRLIGADHVVHIDAESPQEAMTQLWNVALSYKQPVQAKWNSPINLPWRLVRAELTNEWQYLAGKFPDDVSVHYNAGLWMLSVGRAADAETHLRAAAEPQRPMGSASGAVYKNFGLALLYSGKTAQAEAALRAALEQTPPDTGAYCPLAEVYRRTAREEEAARAEVECHNHAQ